MAEKPKEQIKKDYDLMLKEHPEFKHVISKKNWEFIGISDKGTVGWLWDLWAANWYGEGGSLPHLHYGGAGLPRRLVRRSLGVGGS